MTEPGLMRTGRTMAVATLVARITGFLRMVVLAAALGLGTRLLETYTVANNVPNQIYDVVFGGVLGSMVVPLLVRAGAGRTDAGDLYAQRLLSLVVYGLGVAVLATVLLAPQIVGLYAPAFTGQQRELAVTFTRFFVPQILFYGISETLAAVLNTRGRLTAPLWAPVANNVIMVGTAVAYLVLGGRGDLTTVTSTQSVLLGVGTTAGVGVQLLVLVIVTRRSRFPLRLRLNPRGVGLRSIARMVGWTLLYVVAAQSLFAVVSRLATHVDGMSVYQNAYTLFQLPYAVVALSVITGVLPRMSRAAADRDLPRLTDDLSRSLRLTAVVLVPVAAGLMLLGPQIATVLFDHGNTAPVAARLTGATLVAFGLALVPFAGYQIMLRVFYVLQDARTPALIHSTVVAAAIVASLIAAMVVPGKDLVVALASCYAFAYALGAVLAAQVLRRRIGRVDGHRLVRSHGRMRLAALAAGAAGLGAIRACGAALGTGVLGSSAAIGAAGLAGAGVYAVAAHLLRITELRAIVATFRPARTAG
ncbi:murein biosynthesis integral membrane protein MurJ [Solihabitans fulvus]|uniref:Murein biosynthesis integral membrane protein MurJ n=1 Tax=Solihabitans fulvus TaxID=1892852 RepID=A0A5B2WBZ0_9PSEU|nr:murein biosynthesis integral membrane protein MurJ [Solihabitans fulvus]KAA2248744.1 murein biosynthesis integral membrane protein MurJ [Solihabitans fulvus]